MSKRSIEIIGELGENHFKILCSQVGITATKPAMDKYGWDYFIEFLTDINPNIPIDLQQNRIDAKVQIKAFDTNKGYVQIKVSAMYELLKYNGPAFICFIDLDGKNDIQHIYLVHVGEDIIEQVLKSVRKFEYKKINLNTKKISIQFKKDNEIDYTGIALKEKILSFIPTTISDYIKKKNSFLETVGYKNEGPYSFSFSLNSKDIEKFNDTFVGKENSILVNNLTATHTRFDIALPYNVFNNQNENSLCSLIINPLTTHQKLGFKKDKYSTPLIYDVEVTNSPFNNVLPTEKMKILIKNDFFEYNMSFGESQLNFKYSINNKKYYAIDKLLHFLKLPYFLNEANGRMYLEFINSNNTLNSVSLPIEISMNSPFDDILYSLCNKLNESLNTLGITQKPKICINELMQNEAEISTFHNLIFSLELDQINIGFNLNDEGKENLNTDEETFIVTALYIKIENNYYGIFTLLICDMEKNDNGYFTFIKKSKFLDNFTSTILDNEFINEKLQEFTTLVKKDYGDDIQIVTIDLLSLYNKNSN